MADNVTVDNGALTDYLVSSDEAASGHIERMKLCYSADGDDTHVPADVNGLKVNISTAGEVGLSAATLAALESITVVDGGGSLTVDSAQLPGALAAGGGLKVEGVAGGVAQPVSGTVTADTEMPAAAALSDTTANPTAPMVGAGAMLWDGAQWIRARGDAANGIDVDVTRLPALVAGAAEIGGVNQTKVAGTAVSVNSGVKDAGTQRVILASDQTVVPVSDNAGSLTVDAPVGTPAFVRLSDGAAAVAPLTDTQLRASAVPVSVPTLTKGTQGAQGLSTQELRDAGRNPTNYFHAAPIITTAAEVMQTLTGYKSGAAVAATATPAVVTAGKTYRIERITVAYIAATVIGGALLRLRANLSGVGVIGSPLAWATYVGIPAVFTAGAAQTYVFDFPEGLEFAAGTGIALGVIGGGAVPTTGTIAGYVMASIEGYEY